MSSLPTPPKDTVESIIEKLDKTSNTAKDDTSTTQNNSTSILGEHQSLDDFLAAYGLKKD